MLELVVDLVEVRFDEACYAPLRHLESGGSLSVSEVRFDRLRSVQTTIKSAYGEIGLTFCLRSFASGTNISGNLLEFIAMYACFGEVLHFTEKYQ